MVIVPLMFVYVKSWACAVPFRASRTTNEAIIIPKSFDGRKIVIANQLSGVTMSAAKPGQWRPENSVTFTRLWLPRLVGQVVHRFKASRMRTEMNSTKTSAAAQGRTADAISGENAFALAT